MRGWTLVGALAALAVPYMPCAAQTAVSAEPGWEPSPASVQQLHSNKWIRIRPETGIEYDVPAGSLTGMFYVEASGFDGSDAEMNRIADRLAKGAWRSISWRNGASALSSGSLGEI